MNILLRTVLVETTLLTLCCFGGRSLLWSQQMSHSPVKTDFGTDSSSIGPKSTLAGTSEVSAVVIVPVAESSSEEIEPITTERPTVGYSPDTIPARSFQIENGLNFNAQRNQVLADGPESLLRYGVSGHFEVRLQTSDLAYQSNTARGTDRLQSEDLGISTKILVAGPNRMLPKTAVLSLSLPTGGPSFTSGSYDPSMAAIWTQALPKGYFTNEVVQGTLTTYQAARRAAWAPSIVAGRALSERLSIFGEYAPTILADHSLIYVIDGGFGYLPSKLRQIDFRAGYQKDGAGSHTLISLGYSMRRDRNSNEVR